MATVGDICEVSGELTTEWKIKNFSSLSQEIDKSYYSPIFYFSGASWRFMMNPNGETKHEFAGFIGLYLLKVSTGSPVTLDYSVRIKTENGKMYAEQSYSFTFDKKGRGYGPTKYISRSVLMIRKTDLIPSDILTIICTVKTDQTTLLTGSLFNRYAELSKNMKEAYENTKNTDITLQVSGQNVNAHRLILEQRSSVFAAMLSHDMKENQTGEICIKDIEKCTMEVILDYFYSGDIEALTTDNVLSIYAAAEKYDIKVIKEMCSEFIIRNITEDWICDILEFADLYKDEEILLRAREYFKQNARKILKTEKWKTFSKEKNNIVLELFDTVLLSLLPE